MKEMTFDLRHSYLHVREFSGQVEILVENNHQEGPIWLAIGSDQIIKLKAIFEKIKISRDEHLFVSILRFIQTPKTKKEIVKKFGLCDSTLRSIIRNGTAKSYWDDKLKEGVYLTTGKPMPGKHKLWPGSL